MNLFFCRRFCFLSASSRSRQTHLFTADIIASGAGSVPHSFLLVQRLVGAFVILHTFRGFRLTQFNFVLCRDRFVKEKKTQKKYEKLYSRSQPIDQHPFLPACRLPFTSPIQYATQTVLPCYPQSTWKIEEVFIFYRLLPISLEYFSFAFNLWEQQISVLLSFEIIKFNDWFKLNYLRSYLHRKLIHFISLVIRPELPSFFRRTCLSIFIMHLKMRIRMGTYLEWKKEKKHFFCLVNELEKS